MDTQQQDDDTVRVEYWAEWPGSFVKENAEFTRSEWNAMTADDRTKVMDEMAEALLSSNGCGYGHAYDPDEA